MFFEGRTSHGGHSGKDGNSKTPKKTSTKRNSVKKVECEEAIRLADMFYEFVTNRLPNYKLVHNKSTGKSEKVPLPTSKKRMERDFRAMLEDGEYDAGEIEFVLEWYTQGRTHDWKFRTVSSFWNYFPMLRKKCSRTLNPYTTEELSKIMQYLNNRFVWSEEEYEELESVVGRSLFAIEQVEDALIDAGKGRELSYVFNRIGSPSCWVRDYISDMVNSKANSKPNSKIKLYALRVDEIVKEVRCIMMRYGIQSDWINELDISMVRTYNRIREERK
jgi:hypothetical protein